MQALSRHRTLLEWLTVAFACLVGAAIYLPASVSRFDKAREKEVKAGIHSIQVALERYASDNGGFYPISLSGGDWPANYFQRQIMFSQSGCSIHIRGRFGGLTADYERIWEGSSKPLRLWKCDPLIQYDYLKHYPVNPFQKHNNTIWSGQRNLDPESPGIMTDLTKLREWERKQTGMLGIGGRYGDLMFDVAWGLGDCPQTDWIAHDVDNDDPDGSIDSIDNDAEGNFYYHPRFADGRSVAEHKYPDPSDPLTLNGRTELGFEPLESQDVNGYVLYGLGSARSKGRDYFPAHTSVYSPEYLRGDESSWKGRFVMTYGAGWGSYTCQTGYSASEEDPLASGGNPLIRKRDWSGLRKSSPAGPDGKPDWFIVDVSSTVDVDQRPKAKD